MLNQNWHSVVAVLCLVVTVPLPAQDRKVAATQALIARAASLELPTDYVAPPGDPRAHHAAGLAKVLCSAVYVTGLDPEFAVENIGFFTSPYAERSATTWRVDHQNKSVHVTLPDGVTRSAKFIGDLGCVTLPLGKDAPYFEPPTIESSLPDAATTAWPMGDLLPRDHQPEGLDMELIAQAIDAAFDPAEALTAAYLVTYKGQLVSERYRDGITMHTPLESWSMGKSLTATLMGILIKEGVYNLDQPTPIAQWQQKDDPRKKIRIADLLRSGSTKTNDFRFLRIPTSWQVRAASTPSSFPPTNSSSFASVTTEAANKARERWAIRSDY